MYYYLQREKSIVATNTYMSAFYKICSNISEVILGFVRPDAGEVEILGRNIRSEEDFCKKNIGHDNTRL